MGGDYETHSYNRRDQRSGRRDGNRHRGTPLSELDPQLTELSRRVIGAAIEVHKALGPGYTRDIYLKALEFELEAEEIEFKVDHPFDVIFEEDVVGQVRSDMFISDRFLITVMAEQRDVRPHERTALRAQLRAADLELGLVINFGERRLKDGLVRVLNPDKLNALQSGPDDEYDSDDFESDEEDSGSDDHGDEVQA